MAGLQGREEAALQELTFDFIDGAARIRQVANDWDATPVEDGRAELRKHAANIGVALDELKRIAGCSDATN